MLNVLLFILSALSYSKSTSSIHPFYISVSEINYNVESKRMELSVKIFTDDFENTLQKVYGHSINLTIPKDTSLRDQMVASYIQNNLVLSINNKSCTINYLGIEKEEEAVWCYFESEPCEFPVALQIKNTLLYQHVEGQINIMHVRVGNQRKSLKVDQPASIANFNF